MMETEISQPVFSRITKVTKIAGADQEIRLTASAEELEALAAQYGLEQLSRLVAEVTISRRRKGQAKVAGVLQADFVQVCVVTLDPVETALEHRFERHFQPAPRGGDGAEAVAKKEVEIDPLAEDPADYYANDLIDLGQLIAEELGLNIDPYPRKAGVELASEKSDDAAVKGRSDEDDPHPFAALKNIKPGSG